MVTAKTQYSLKNAKGYFEEHLCVGDYYEEGQRVSGEWFGVGAQRLGLSGNVFANDFLPLCENKNPRTGETLTQRLKTTRTEEGQSVANRRVFFDFTVSPPKSVSLVAFLGEDQRIFRAHDRAVREMLREFEAFVATRIRTGGQQVDRLTSNFAVAMFTHDTSRALDPHLHTHCIVFNATFDPVEQRWKALQNHELLRARKFAENAYYHELARELRGFGYRIGNRARGDFEIDGVSEDLCRRFSKRDAEVDAALAKLLAEQPELADGNIHEMRRRLATSERPKKQRSITRGELKRLCDAQITESERASMRNLTAMPSAIPGARVTVTEAIQWAEEHLFDRNSMVPECQVWQEALGRARGEDFSVAELKHNTQARGYIRNEARPGDVTLHSVLVREWELVQAAKEGVGVCHPLVPTKSATKSNLDQEQDRALSALLSSTNRVSLFRGGAGSGKSFVLRELVEQVQKGDRPVIVLAPQRQQVVEIEHSGFPSAQTVTHFLERREVPEGALIVVDEAGQIGGRQMLQLLQCVRRTKGRLVLSGDTRQHGPVEASDALVAIERYSGVRPVELHKIRRQDPDLGRDDEERRRIRDYRRAVEAAAAGNMKESFSRLEAMGAVVCCGLGEQAAKLSDEYVNTVEQNASAVVVSQTWTEVHRVNALIRDALKSKGLLGPQDWVIQALEKLDLTDAQKRDERFYPAEATIVFNQKVRDAEPGRKGKLAGIVKAGVLVEVDGRFITVQNRLLDHITVCLSRDMSLAEGDRLHLKANRKLASGARVTNGELVTVKSVHGAGGIELADGRILDASFREFLAGYAVTSHGSQGKTVDYVLFSDSTIKAATNAEQWYVSISRGRRGIRIFTPDKEQLRENLTRSGHRPLALDLVAGVSISRNRTVWARLRGYLLRFGKRATERLIRIKSRRSRTHQPRITNEYETTRVLGERRKRSRSQNRNLP